MEKICYLILMSSGLDSTATLLNLINKKDLKDDLMFPTYIWWRNIFTDVLKKEIENCQKILDYIKKKYEGKKLRIKNLKKIEVPLIFYEQIREIFKELDRPDYFCYFRNGIFIFSSLSYLLNYLKIQGIIDYQKIVIVAGFIGYEADENKPFTEAIKVLVNRYIQDSTKKGIIDNIDFYTPYLLDEDTRTRSKQYNDIKEFGDWEILKYTWSCWRNYEKPCNQCSGCISRRDKFLGIDIKDPKYKDPMI